MGTGSRLLLGLGAPAHPLVRAGGTKRHILLSPALHAVVVVVADAVNPHRRHFPMVWGAQRLLRGRWHAALLPVFPGEIRFLRNMGLQTHTEKDSPKELSSLSPGVDLLSTTHPDAYYTLGRRGYQGAPRRESPTGAGAGLARGGGHADPSVGSIGRLIRVDSGWHAYGRTHCHRTPDAVDARLRSEALAGPH